LAQEDIDMYFPDAKLQGKMEKAQDIYPGVDILSVKISKVGKTTIEKFPDLKWIINRSHGNDNINFELCKKHKINVISTYPNTDNCVNWILDKTKLQKTDCFVIFGFGHIGKKFSENITEKYYIIQKPNVVDFNTIKNSKYKHITIIVTVPLTDSTINLITDGFIEKFGDKFITIITISRADTMDNEYLLKTIKSGKLLNLYVDTLGVNKKDELLATGKVFYTKHTAWCFGGVNKQRELTDLKKIIDNL
jgi:lactate dehydrogenase-like 2-hydroxyacid dehydrogenase